MASDDSTNDATAGDAPRVIDENTDLSTLTDQEIMQLMENMNDADAAVTNRQPLISAPVPLIAIKQEYLRGSAQVLRKLDWLESKGWDQVWRARGDGDCFYRSFTLAYLVRMAHAPDRVVVANAALEAIDRTGKTMASVGFDSDLLEEFLEPLLVSVRAFTTGSVSEYTILETLQDTEKSNCIVVALRLMTSAYIRTHPDAFAPFLFSPVTYEPMTPDDFCRQEVEPCGKEADQAQITALSESLGVHVRVAYLDPSEVKTGESGDVINWVEFGSATEGDLPPLTLLYRPGHYDVVTKDYMLA